MDEDYTPEFKTQVVIEALKGKQSEEQIASEYGISQQQIAKWRDTAPASMSDVFSKRKLDKEQRRVEAAHLKRIARLQAPVDKRRISSTGCGVRRGMLGWRIKLRPASSFMMAYHCKLALTSIQYCGIMTSKGRV